MRNGETLRFHGPNGAEFVVTVGAVFDAEYIQKMVDSLEWAPIRPSPVPVKPARGRPSKKIEAR